MRKNCLLWFRKDLRLHDNLALNEAANFENIYPIFIMDDDIYENKYLGEASLWWLESSLQALNIRINNKLNLFKGDSIDIIFRLCSKLDIQGVYWNRCYEADRIKKDTTLKKKLLENNVEAKSFNSSLLWEPWDIKNKSGNAYKVFTPFFKSGCLSAKSPRSPKKFIYNENFQKVELDLPRYKTKFINKKNHWSNKFKMHWDVGEISAKNSLKKFINDGAKNYSLGRNFPALPNVSRLSPHLHWGEISPFEVWNEAKSNMIGDNKDVFLSELGWREFSYHLLYNFPNLQTKNLKTNFNDFPWIEDLAIITKWKNGETGYPIIDAGMRELWETGYMHNRVRMITASFLVKNLLANWQHGQKWFWDCLLDADAASNSASWQWVAGTGTDSTPFFRIFNPISQSKKFDNDADYIRKFLPELQNLPNKYIFSPFDTDKNILKQYGVILGGNYPYPIVDYSISRKRALNTYTNFINRN